MSWGTYTMIEQIVASKLVALATSNYLLFCDAYPAIVRPFSEFMEALRNYEIQGKNPKPIWNILAEQETNAAVQRGMKLHEQRVIEVWTTLSRNGCVLDPYKIH